MTIRYLDPAATGAGTGADWANAYTDLQVAADAATAGDIVYCRGTQTGTVRIDFDTNAGAAETPIKFVGCNASGNIDGTRFVLDMNDTDLGLSLNGCNYLWLQNIEIHSTTTNRGIFTAGTTDYVILQNCYIHDTGSYGIDGAAGLRFLAVIDCVIDTCGGTGIFKVNSGRVCGLQLSNITGNGLEFMTSAFSIKNVLCYNVSGIGLNVGADRLISNCVCHSCGTGATITGSNEIIEGCRFTNCTTGLNISSGFATLFNCYFQSNTTAISGTYVDVDVNGVSTNTLAGSDTDYGYVNSAGGDFNLAATATGRNIAVLLNG